jgi:hypothetical protein
MVLAKVKSNNLRKVRVHQVPYHACVHILGDRPAQRAGQRVSHAGERGVYKGGRPVDGARPRPAAVLPELALQVYEGAVGEVEDARGAGARGRPWICAGGGLVEEGDWDVGLAVVVVEGGVLVYGAVGCGVRRASGLGEAEPGEDYGGEGCESHDGRRGGLCP